jgi:hypothetical protein
MMCSVHRYVDPVYLAIAGMSFVFDAALVTVHILDQQRAIFSCAVLLLLVYLNSKHCWKTFCGAMNVIAYDAGAG